MARAMRIAYPGAVYHVTARGNRHCEIFTEDEDGQAFLVILGEVSRRFNLLCHAYCLMGNHYHLILETPDGNLPRAMRQLNGVYTQIFNKRHCKCGHVFQGRYKAILIEKAAYLLEACRYVVLNPVRAGLVAGPADWRWSSYRSMVGLEPPPDFLATEWVLRQFSDDPLRARDVYAGFVKDGAGEKIWEDLLGGVVLGSELFAQERAAYGQSGGDFGEIPRRQRLLARPALAEILSAPGDRGGKWLKAVDVCGYAQKEVARYEGMHYSYVSRVLRRERSKIKGCLITFLSLKRANGAFRGAFMDSVEKAESYPIIGGGLGRLPDITAPEAAFSHNKWLTDSNLDFAGFGMNAGGYKGCKVSMGVGVTRLSDGDFAARNDDRSTAGSYSAYDQVVSVGAAIKGFGLAVKYIQSSIAGVRAQAFAIDLGAKHKMRSLPLTLGFGVQNLGNGIKYLSQRDNLPLSVNAGASFMALTGIALSVDAKRMVCDKQTVLSAGTEYAILAGNDMGFALRGGYGLTGSAANSKSGLSVGAGVKAFGAEVDYAVSPETTLGSVQRITLRKRF